MNEDQKDLIRKLRRRRPRLSWKDADADTSTHHKNSIDYDDDDDDGNQDDNNSAHPPLSLLSWSLSLTEYLESTCYGEEDDISTSLLESLLLWEPQSFPSKHNNRSNKMSLEDLPWNIQWRLWLIYQQRRRNSTNNKNNNNNNNKNQLHRNANNANPLLSSILAHLQSQALLCTTVQHSKEQDTTVAATDLMEDNLWTTPHNNNKNKKPNSSLLQLDPCWNHDPMLVLWKQHQRFHVLKDLKKIWESLLPLEQRCVIDIVQAVDVVTGYHHDGYGINSSNTSSSCSSSAGNGGKKEDADYVDSSSKGQDSQKASLLNIVESIMNNQQHRPKSNKGRLFLQNSSSDMMITRGVPEYYNDRGMEIFRNCLMSLSNNDESRQQKNVVQKRMEALNSLVQKVGDQGTRGKWYHRLADSLSNEPQDSELSICLLDQIPWLAKVQPDDDDETVVRGKALCLYLLLSQYRNNGHLRSDQQNNSRQRLAEPWRPPSIPAWTIPLDTKTTEAALFQHAVETHILKRSKETGITPDVEAFVERLWECCCSSKPSDSSCPFWMTAFETIRNWLPVEPIGPLFRSKLQEILSVDRTVMEEREEGSQIAFLAMNPIPKDTVHSKKEQEQQCLLIRNATNIALLCCNEHPASVRILWRSVFDESMIRNTILPLCFWHAKLMLNRQSVSAAKDHDSEFLEIGRAIQCFCCLLEILQEHSALETLLETVPELVDLLNLFTNLNASIDLQNDTVSDNYHRFGQIYQSIQEFKVATGKEGALQLSVISNSLVAFAQTSKMSACDQWIQWIVNLLQEHGGNADEVLRSWLSGLVRQLISDDAVDCSLSLLAEKLHETLIKCNSESASPPTCVFDIILSEILDKIPNNTIRGDVFVCTLRGFSPQLLFAGCDGKGLVVSLGKACSFCRDYSLLLDAVLPLLVGVALQLDNFANKKDIGNEDNEACSEAWAACKSTVFDFLQERVITGRNYTDIHALMQQVASHLESLHFNRGLAWWNDVCVCFEDRNSEYAKEVEAALASQSGRSAKATLGPVERLDIAEKKQDHGKSHQVLQPEDNVKANFFPTNADSDSESDEESNDEILLLDL